MKKHIDIWLSDEPYQKIKEFAGVIYENHPEAFNPMSQAVDIVVKRGLALDSHIEKIKKILDEYKQGQDAKYLMTKVAGIVVDYGINHAGIDKENGR